MITFCVRIAQNILCHEDFMALDRGISYHGLHTVILLAGLCSLLQTFNCRDLSYLLKGGFTGGLPGVIFDIALL
jgi:hypothetical protein